MFSQTCVILSTGRCGIEGMWYGRVVVWKGVVSAWECPRGVRVWAESLSPLPPPYTATTAVGTHPTRMQTNHIISLEPISKKPASNPFHEVSMTSVSIDVIGAFWQAVKRELYKIV